MLPRCKTTRKCYGLVATSLLRITSELASDLSLPFPAPFPCLSSPLLFFLRATRTLLLSISFMHQPNPMHAFLPRSLPSKGQKIRMPEDWPEASGRSWIWSMHEKKSLLEGCYCCHCYETRWWYRHHNCSVNSKHIHTPKSICQV